MGGVALVVMEGMKLLEGLEALVSFYISIVFMLVLSTHYLQEKKKISGSQSSIYPPLVQLVPGPSQKGPSRFE